MESRTKNKQTNETIAQMAERAFGVSLASSGDAVTEMTDGWFNAVYNVGLSDGRETVLKIAPPANARLMTYETNLIATEVGAMRLVRTNRAVPVPEIYAFDDTRTLCDAPYFFMEKLAGENLEHAKASLTQEAQARIRFEIGEIMRKINAFSGDYFGYPGNPELRAGDWRSAFLKIMDSVLADGQARGVDYGIALPDLRGVIENHAPVLDEVRAPRLVHWDGWDMNFFVRDERITGLVDFERALWADPLMEAQFRPFGGTFANDVFRGYGKSSFTPSEERRCALYTLHLGLVMITECAYRNYDTDAVEKHGRAILASALRALK